MTWLKWPLNSAVPIIESARVHRRTRGDEFEGSRRLPFIFAPRPSFSLPHRVVRNYRKVFRHFSQNSQKRRRYAKDRFERENKLFLFPNQKVHCHFSRFVNRTLKNAFRKRQRALEEDRLAFSKFRISSIFANFAKLRRTFRLEIRRGI